MRPLLLPLAVLALALPLDLAAQPEPGAGIEFAVVSSAPDSRWEALYEDDTLTLDAFPDPYGPQPLYWSRIRYRHPRSLGPHRYDTRYERFVVRCEERTVQLVRLVWTQGGTPVAEEPAEEAPMAASPGTVAGHVLDLVCAQRSAASGSAP